LTGKTPIDYINSLRINKAILLLNEGKYNITEIALACGFCDQIILAECSKKHTGTAPIKVFTIY
jgi:transcriptional regulator GlxA family with amidase domain